MEVTPLPAGCTDWGQASLGKGKLRINVGLTDTQSRITVVHEIFHTITYQSGHVEASEDNGLMIALANGWLQVMRDNPKLIEKLMEK